MFRRWQAEVPAPPEELSNHTITASKLSDPGAFSGQAMYMLWNMIIPDRSERSQILPIWPQSTGAKDSFSLLAVFASRPAITPSNIFEEHIALSSSICTQCQRWQASPMQGKVVSSVRGVFKSLFNLKYDILTMAHIQDHYGRKARV